MLPRGIALLGIVVLLGGMVLPVTHAQPESMIVIAQGTDITSLDPAFSKVRNDDNVYLELFDTLVTRDAQMRFQPLLAESWTILNPNLWQFKLRKGITFSDNEPFTAAAVKYSIERVYDPALNA